MNRSTWITLYIIRGLPGTGKSTLGETLAPGHFFAADDYFYDDQGNYNFDPTKLGEAHAQCQGNVRDALILGAKRADQNRQISLKWNWSERRIRLVGTRVAVCNTFSQRWEFEPYIKMANEFGARYFLIDLFDNNTPIEALHKRNTHGVPMHVYDSMLNRWEK